jgi:hypothetical protein
MRWSITQLRELLVNALPVFEQLWKGLLAQEVALPKGKITIPDGIGDAVPVE